MLLQIQHIAKAFGDKKVLTDVSFNLEKGKAVVLMGTNGSGKTTLFNIISGFLEPDNGKVILKNDNINKLKPHQRNVRGIGRTFQDMRLIGDLTVIENVLLAFQHQEGEKWWRNLLPGKLIDKEQNQHVNKANLILKDCFIDDVIANKAAEISYGQQKLLNLACCIANNAAVLLLDEPVAGVNPAYKTKLETIIDKLKQNKAILIIEHNTDFIKGVADDILFLNNGTISHFESYAAMRSNETVQEAYI